MDDNAFREAATASIDEIIKYYASLGGRPVVSTVEPGYLRKLLPDAAPEQGEAWDVIRQDVEDKIVPGLTHWQSPNFFAFFPCPSSYPSILGELYSATFAAAAFNWICSPAITELETVVLDWLAQLLGLPEEYLSTGPTRGGGVIHGTASEAVMTMMTAAADKYLRAALAADHAGFETLSDEEQEDLRAARRARLVALGGGTAHSSAKKAAQVLGLRYRSIPAPAANGYAINGDGLRATLAKVRAAGLEPFFLSTTFGTTDTCAVDDFASIADVLDADLAAQVAAGRDAAASDIWVHVDGAYAGSALVAPETRATMCPAPRDPADPNSEPTGTAVLRRFHSFNMNMHKWLLTNFDCSCAFVRDRRWLVDALGADAHYYKNDYSDGGLVTDYRDWQLPLGRRFRSLKAWFVLRTYGGEGLRAYIRRSISLGERFADSLKARPDLFEIITGPQFALTVFRAAKRTPDEPLEVTSARTRRVCELVNGGGKIWVTGTTLEGNTAAIRVMTGNFSTHTEHVDGASKIFVETAEKVLAEEKTKSSESLNKQF
ncbi:aromatic-L-amino-acid decarboxylase [Sporothrix brasiliensis 5110]|uniref:Aromatic-L-amino-acid decarboxylase n=1 Tax=Sporothrix brasiliensis 5110 TaxID=1398154 RepID=A0A0C2IZ75_9PEZI|nr:aromatic-L-amino-acid decarboxylase [Sporothrix brasiliensis 5110]KIH90282.1 aromatic-L-amino-acid decarboxylase [Sporothrix brasiliensis 5110]